MDGCKTSLHSMICIENLITPCSHLLGQIWEGKRQRTAEIRQMKTRDLDSPP